MSKFRVTKSATFTRPANTTPYSVGDLVANHATAGSVVAMTVAAARFPGGNGEIVGIQIEKSSPILTDAAFRVHFFLDAPSFTNGDNGVFAPSNGLAKKYLGHSPEIIMDTALGDGAMGRAVCAIQFDTLAPSDDLYFVIEATDTYTPVSGEVFKVELELERD